MFRLLTTLVVLALSGSALGQFRCPEKNGYYPDPVQCDLYYHCQSGEAEEKLCPDGLVFDDNNPSHERCDTPVNVECGDRVELHASCGWFGEGGTQHWVQGVCQQGFRDVGTETQQGCPRANGFFRHWEDDVCDKFVNCIDGVANEVPCPPGLVYDDEASTCKWASDSVRKDCNQSKRDKLEDGFSCPVGEVTGPNGRTLPHPTFPHPDDCQKFYICRNAVIPQYGSCGPGLVYNEESFKCDEPENVPGCENWFDEDKKKP